MGTKRKRSEATERLIAEKLGSGNSLRSDDNPWKAVGNQVVEEIRDDFSAITEADQIGGSLNTLGDIKLATEDGSTVYVETKFVKNGGGTLANLWGDALTDLGQFNDAMSWSEFRRNTNHSGWVNSHLDRFSYPSTFDFPEGNKTNRYKKAGHLKDVIGWTKGQETDEAADEIKKSQDSTEDQLLAADIILNITTLEEEEKLNYLRYLNQKEQNSEIIKRLSILLILGIHTKEKIMGYADTAISELQVEAEKYIMYVGRRNDGSVVKWNPEDFIDSLLDKEFSCRFDEDNTSIKIVTSWNGEQKPLLRASLHWGNKFQGIETPSIRVFRDDILKQLESEESKIPY